MDQEQPKKDQEQPETDTGYGPKEVAPRPAAIIDEKPPQNAEATKPEKQKDKTNDIPQTSQKDSFRFRAWEWVKNDTKSTDWLIVFLTAVIAGTSYLQWKEIRSGSSDTHDLAVAAKTQADAAKSQSEQAKAQTDKMAESLKKTDDLIKQATEQAKAINRMADAAKTQAGISQRVLETSSNNFRMDQRPYVWPAKFYQFPLKVGEQISANVYFVNYGKTPALRKKSAGRILVLSATEGVLKQADAFFATFDKDESIAGGSENILPPGIPPDPTKSLDFVTARSEEVPPNQFAVDEINKTDGSFAIVGVVIYFDSEGTKYRSNFCTMHTEGGSWAWCERHNEIR